MLIPIEDLSRHFGIHPAGVLHVGAHNAEESDDYNSHRWGSVIWVDMLPEKVAALKKRFAHDPDNVVLQAACWNTDDEELPIFRAENGQSSSLLKPDLHLESHPDIKFRDGGPITTSRLDSILPPGSKFDFINFDTQGAELRALEGLGRHLDSVKWAYLEVNTRQLYDGCALLHELDAFLEEHCFRRIATKMYSDTGWGDALYVNMTGMSSWDASAWRWRSITYFIRRGIRDFCGKIGHSIRKRMRDGLSRQN